VTNLACVIPTWRDGALLSSAVRSVRPHVDIVICLDGGYLGDVSEEDRWSPSVELIEAQKAGAVLYPVIERNASEAAYERHFGGFPEDYEPLPAQPLDPPLSCLESYETKVAALLDLARRHMVHGWALVMHADELLICGDGLRDELAPFYSCAMVDVPRWADDETWVTRLHHLDGGDDQFTPSLPAMPGAPFLRHRAYLRSPIGSR
jgi:hypothetical protein